MHEHWHTLMSDWKEKYLKLRILRSSDGRTVFFPFGPFKGFVIEDSDLDSPLFSYCGRFQQFCLWTSIIAMFVLKALNFSPLYIVFLSLLELILYRIGVHQRTKHLSVLPIGLSIRFYACWYDYQMLCKGFLMAFFIAVLSGFFVFAGPPRIPAIECFVLMSAVSIISGYVLWVRHREDSLLSENAEVNDRFTAN